MSMKQILLFCAPFEQLIVSRPSLTVTIRMPSNHFCVAVGVAFTIEMPSASTL
jgi:hypothetical protein